MSENETENVETKTPSERWVLHVARWSRRRWVRLDVPVLTWACFMCIFYALRKLIASSDALTPGLDAALMLLIGFSTAATGVVILVWYERRAFDRIIERLAKRSEKDDS